MKFTIGFDTSDTAKLHACWDDIIRSGKWTEAKYTALFEEKWAAHAGATAVAFSGWGGAALAALEYFKIRGKTVLCPSNTFMATPLSVVKAGGRVEFVDCNRDDLCLSFEDLKRQADRHKPAAVWVVHIGGHIAFEIEKIADFCREKGIVLLEDCAHAHGAAWHGRRAGTWGDAGVYSFYGTKTISTGEGGMLVTRHADLAAFARQFRNYGKFDYVVEGYGLRMNEFTAAIGCVQADRLDDIVAWKNEYARARLDGKYPNRVRFPDGMVSGFYKYIVFDPVEKSTGKVYDLPCHTVMKKAGDFPNTEWVAKNHWCVPLYYKGDEAKY
ncbi:MAG: aminotransferase class I/II-fold pyridoxal phosphate-dependent enzyme [Planctomycetota bacterium]